MATIRHTIDLGADAATVWDALRDFPNVHRRVAAGFVVDARTGEGGDEIRTVTFANGAVAREVLVSAEDERRRLVYSVVDSLLGLTHHQASVEVLDRPDAGGSTFVWTADVLPHAAAATVGPMMAAGAAAIARTLGG